MTELKIGQLVKILGFKSGNKALHHRLLSWGLVPQTQLKIVRIAPFGDPVEIQFLGGAGRSSLCLRRQDLFCLDLDVIASV